MHEVTIGTQPCDMPAYADHRSRAPRPRHICTFLHRILTRHDEALLLRIGAGQTPDRGAR